MPRKRAARGPKNTKANAKKTAEAVHETPGEVLEDLLTDIDAQGQRCDMCFVYCQLSFVGYIVYHLKCKRLQRDQVYGAEDITQAWYQVTQGNLSVAIL